jgi:hypothetical protein
MSLSPVKPLLLALALAGAVSAQAAELSAEVAQALKQMQERLARLEARNAELERQFAAQPAPTLEARMKQLETANAQMEASLTSERLSQDEPEIATRLKAVEFQALGMQKQARMVESLEGIAAGVSFTTVAQHANGGATTAGDAESELSWRGDAQVSLPGGSLGNTEGSLFFHFRMGQGNGLSSLNPGFSVPNATAFQIGATLPDDASPILAQAWYQLSAPLDDRPLDKSRKHLEINFGKIDPFLFFDQNAAADDETVRFMNLAFVHNPLLDAGGAAGVDAYGFTPGVRLAYFNDTQAPLGWGASLGVFGSDTGAAFSDSLQQPFVILQAETAQRFFGGLSGNYRLYAWRNGRAMHHDGITLEAQSGWGLSADQRVGDGITLWGRYGHGMQGNPAFDRALTLGAEFSGNYWDRGADGVGVGLGWLAASDSYKAANPTLAGAEQLAELYYRWRVNPQFELSPDYQFIRRAGADGDADDAHILGLRAQLTF